MHRWVEYEREELYELVWSKPMSQIAEEEGLSGRGLAKICEKMNIPLPAEGLLGQSPSRATTTKAEASQMETGRSHGPQKARPKRR